MKSPQAYRLQVSWRGDHYFIYLRSLLKGVLPQPWPLLTLDYPRGGALLNLPDAVPQVEGYRLSCEQLRQLLFEHDSEIPLAADARWARRLGLWVLRLYQEERWFPEVEGDRIRLRLLLDSTQARQAAAHFKLCMPGSLGAGHATPEPDRLWSEMLAGWAQAVGWTLLTQGALPFDRRDLDCLPLAYRRLLTALQAGPEASVPEVTFVDARQVSLATRDRVSSLAFEIRAPGRPGEEWELRPRLRSLDSSEHCDALSAWQTPDLIPASLVPRGKGPRSHLLEEFGRGLRVFPALGASLASSPPTPITFDDEEMAEFLARQAGRLKAYGYELLGPEELTRARSPRLILRVDPSAEPAPDEVIQFHWGLALGDVMLDPEALQEWRQQPDSLLFSQGQWFWVDRKETLARLRQLEKQPLQGTLLEAMQLAGEAQLEYSGKLTPLSLAEGFEEQSEPAGFQGRLRDYQRRGFSWLWFMRKLGLGTCLADDMGLGKTVQTLAFLLALKEQRRLQRALLVCPTSVLGNWRREAERFTPGLRLLLHHGERSREPAEFAESLQHVDLVLTTYPLLVRDKEHFLPLKWDLVVLDEAQQIKNSGSQSSRVCRQLEARARCLLTGTPVENRLDELWSLFRFLQPELLDSKRKFQTRFARPIERLGDSAAKHRLRQLVGPFILRRVKSDPRIAAELPHKLETTVECHLTGEQQDLYREEAQQSLKQLRSQDGSSRRASVLSLLSRLKQLCDHPALLEEDDPDWQSERSGKLNRLYEILDDLSPSEGVLVFSQYARMVRRLQVDLTETLGEEVLVLDGSVARKDRDRAVERFQSGRGPRLFCISLRAGGLGLNLTRASTVVHFDRWWNPAVEAQATDRAFRIGQTRNVQVFKFVTRDTLEEQIENMLTRKQALMDDLIDEGDAWLTELNDDELSQLLLPTRRRVGDERRAEPWRSAGPA